LWSILPQLAGLPQLPASSPVGGRRLMLSGLLAQSRETRLCLILDVAKTDAEGRK
jgi:hypothetical protein